VCGWAVKMERREKTRVRGGRERKEVVWGKGGLSRRGGSYSERRKERCLKIHRS
jgi:hypothetical protein